MKVYREANLLVNLEEVIFIDTYGDGRTKFQVVFHLKGNHTLYSRKFETLEDCQRVIKMCYDTMTEEEWD